MSGAAELAAALVAKRDGKGTWWNELELSAILMPRRVALVEDADELEFGLRTRGGSEILWGRAPGSRHPGNFAVALKLQRLSEYRRDFGGFDDAHGPYQIDIRPWQGIDRGFYRERRSRHDFAVRSAPQSNGVDLRRAGGCKSLDDCRSITKITALT